MGLELLLGCLVFSGMLMTVPRAIADVIETVKAANAGQWDVINRDRDRRAARTARWADAWRKVRQGRHRQAGGDGRYKPGLGAYLDDVYHGWCQDLLDRRRSKRQQRGPAVYDPNRKPWHEQVDDAVFALWDRARHKWRNRGNAPLSNTWSCPGCGEPMSAPRDDAMAVSDLWCGNCRPRQFPAEPEPSGDAATTPVPAEPAPSPTPPSTNEGEPDMSTGEGIRAEGETQAEADARTARAEAQFNAVHNPTTGGSTMPQSNTAGTATGDAHDLESASQQCDLLDDDLTAINTALDVIDERIDSAGNATELIEAFLKSKDMPDTAVGGMSVARDMLSPTHIKALIDAIAAAMQGVRTSKEAIDTMHDQATEALQGAAGSVVNNR
jgi:hypothetical protein